MDINQLYKLYINDVYRYLLSLSRDQSLAEDLTQDTFMKAYGALEKSPPKAMKSWLLKIAYHTFIDYVRRNKKMDIEEPGYFLNIKTGASAEEEVQKKIDKEELYTRLDQLKEVQKLAILLCDLKGYTYQQAAAALSLNENTLKSHIFRGRAKLKQLYKKGSDGDE
ncbi:sigma-70 family RNA polymerase sigma factor [Halobacillus salinus]|uniref:RNA polymerase sigma factor n=1 Tax=Halobacillus salinus TaxID=192814 RepID=A0A4Z0GX41_9BACI|nr:sigma-70 family RNA polymerase sigma factor [Halobacillus salinus]TGB01099.1 sigma-70 family RNA polymerase sigma factor [Halobacillus salinus]